MMTRRRRTFSRLAVLLLVVTLNTVMPVQSASTDAREIIEKAFEAARANEAVARNYVYQERMEERRFNKKGKAKKQESRTYDVTLLDTSEHRRLIAINDLPVYPKTAAKEQRKLDKRLEKMRRETPKQREKRLAKVAKGREEGEQFLDEITRAFEFRLIGEESIDGVETFIITADPKDGYRPSSREAKALPKIHATVWIAKKDYGWVKADIETIGNITWGIVFKLHEGAKVQFKQRYVNDEVWMTESWSARVRARTALVYKFNREFVGSYSKFRRFTTESTPVYDPEE